MPKLSTGPRGRPQKLTPAVQDAICTTLLACGTVEDACTLAGIAASTYRTWKLRGMEQRRGRFRDFLTATRDALARRRVTREELILKAGLTDWRATAWLMERAEPLRYAPRVRVHIERELSSAVERVEEEFTGEPELLQRALGALATDPGEDSEIE